MRPWLVSRLPMRETFVRHLDHVVGNAGTARRAACGDAGSRTANRTIGHRGVIVGLPCMHAGHRHSGFAADGGPSRPSARQPDDRASMSTVSSVSMCDQIFAATTVRNARRKQLAAAPEIFAAGGLVLLTHTRIANRPEEAHLLEYRRDRRLPFPADAQHGLGRTEIPAHGHTNGLYATRFV